jgi:dihydroorotase-like cyclic amidohydrolase
MNTSTDVHGPIDFLLLEFPRDRLTGEAAQALIDLVEAGTVRLYDLMVVSKDLDGNVEVLEMDEDSMGFSYFSGARSGLLGDDDVAEAAGALEPNTVAALIVYENTWAIPFVAAARKNGGEVVASMRIPAGDIMDTLDALEATT